MFRVSGFFFQCLLPTHAWALANRLLQEFGDAMASTRCTSPSSPVFWQRSVILRAAMSSQILLSPCVPTKLLSQKIPATWQLFSFPLPTYYDRVLPFMRAPPTCSGLLFYRIVRVSWHSKTFFSFRRSPLMRIPSQLDLLVETSIFAFATLHDHIQGFLFYGGDFFPYSCHARVFSRAGTFSEFMQFSSLLVGSTDFHCPLKLFWLMFFRTDRPHDRPPVSLPLLFP